MRLIIPKKHLLEPENAVQYIRNGQDMFTADVLKSLYTLISILALVSGVTGFRGILISSFINTKIIFLLKHDNEKTQKPYLPFHENLELDIFLP